MAEEEPAMTHYYVNREAQDNGDHEVHEAGCDQLPEVWNRHYLGYFESCDEAVREAIRLYYPKSDGCGLCSLPCHTS